MSAFHRAPEIILEPKNTMTNWYPFVKIEINGKHFNAICDMTEFSIMPKTIYKSLGLWGLSESASYLKIADNSSKIPLGKIEDVQTKFCGNLFPVDYYVVECIGEGKNYTWKIILEICWSCHRYA